ncbi:MAG: BtpA/SgcQ family protein, partial [Microcystaceae cyanobacterium]
QAADGVIVASSLKRNGKLSEPIDPIRVAQFVEAVREVTEKKSDPILASNPHRSPIENRAS